MKSNDHIREFLSYYCALESAPHYAVLLSGKWGSGKTWFIKDFKANDRKLNKRLFYLSLYGLQSLKDIEAECFRLRRPWRSLALWGWMWRVFIDYFKSKWGVDLGRRETIRRNITGNDAARKILGKIHLTPNQVLVVDDLERCSIPIVDLLGYINQFVEHGGLKAILIANEEEIEVSSEGNGGKGYWQIKEKLIGRTFEVAPEISLAADGFIGRLPESTARTIAENNKGMIRRVYESSGYRNLRLLRQALEEFHRLTLALDIAPLECDSLLVELLERHLILSFEVRSGQIKPEEITRLNQLTLFFGGDKQGDAEERLTTIRNKYDGLNAALPLVTDAVWESIFTRGVVPRDELNECLHNSRYLRTTTQASWVKLWHGTRLSDEEFPGVLAEVEAEWNSRHYKKLGEVIHVAGLFIRYIHSHLLNKRVGDVVESAKAYVDWLLEQRHVEPLEPNESPVTLERQGHAGLGYASLENPEFLRFLDGINAQRKDAFQKSLPERAHLLLAVINTDPGDFERQVTLGNDGGGTYYKTALLHYIKADEFVDGLIGTSREKWDVVGSALRVRYKPVQIAQELLEEENWLTQVGNLLVQRAKEREGKVSSLALSELHERCIGPSLQLLAEARQAKKSN